MLDVRNVPGADIEALFQKITGCHRTSRGFAPIAIQGLGCSLFLLLNFPLAIKTDLPELGAASAHNIGAIIAAKERREKWQCLQARPWREAGNLLIIL